MIAERVGRLAQEADTITDNDRAVELLRDYDAPSQSTAAGVGIGAENAVLTDWIVDALIERYGWRVAPNSPLRRRLTELVGQRQIEATQRFQQEVNGDPVRVLDHTFSLK